MPPSLIEEDGPSRFERLLNITPPTFEKCIYIEMRPSRPYDDHLYYIHYVKSHHVKNRPGKPPKDLYQIRTSRSDFLFDILENYSDSMSELFHRFDDPNYENQFPASSRDYLTEQPVRYFMLLHDFRPQQHQEQFLMVELDNTPLKRTFLNHRNFKTLCKRLPRKHYYDSFEQFLNDFPIPSHLRDPVPPHKARLVKSIPKFYKKFAF